jgi:hypothetical protein
MTAQTYSAIPAIELEPARAPTHPLRPVFVTVIALKLAVSVFLLANVSLAPPIATDAQYMSVASAE